MSRLKSKIEARIVDKSELRIDEGRLILKELVLPLEAFP
jgi:hypothetical protein